MKDGVEGRVAGEGRWRGEGAGERAMTIEFAADSKSDLEQYPCRCGSQPTATPRSQARQAEVLSGRTAVSTTAPVAGSSAPGPPRSAVSFILLYLDYHIGVARPRALHAHPDGCPSFGSRGICGPRRGQLPDTIFTKGSARPDGAGSQRQEGAKHVPRLIEGLHASLIAGSLFYLRMLSSVSCHGQISKKRRAPHKTAIDVD